MKDTTHLENRRRGRGRHPLLEIGKLTGDVYRWLKLHPDLTIAEVHSALKGNRQSINAAIQRLKGEGLVIQVPKQKGNRVIRPYRVVEENETGFARDRVKIITTIFVNRFGEYSAVSRVEGQLPTATQDDPQPVHVAENYTVVPKSNEPYKTRHMFDKAFTGGGSDPSDGMIIDITPNEHKDA